MLIAYFEFFNNFKTLIERAVKCCMTLLTFEVHFQLHYAF